MLTNTEILRYGRQMIVPGFGRQGQERIQAARVLVVGLGGLGSPLALYLAAAGVGTLGLADYDSVETSNLNRQIIHSEASVGTCKTASAKRRIGELNPLVVCELFATPLVSGAETRDLVSRFDVVADCTDNVPTRYLLSDACVAAGKILVSGAAIRMSGQLSVYNLGGGPCYRCVFPNPPAASAVATCDDAGVIGAAVGAVGSMQALEVLRILATGESAYSGRLLSIDFETGEFRNVRLRGRRSDCVSCSTPKSILDNWSEKDYVQYCFGLSAKEKSLNVEVLGLENRVSVTELKSALEEVAANQNKKVLVVDVRDKTQYGICSLEGSLNVPFPIIEKFENSLSDLLNLVGSTAIENCVTELFFICRRGNDSQLAAKIFLDRKIPCKDVIGGLVAWAKHVDVSFPIY